MKTNKTKAQKTGLSAKDENKYGMYLNVQKVGVDNPTVLVTIPAFVTDFNDFKGCAGRIKGLSKQRAEPTKGIALDKKSCREQMCKSAAIIAGAVHSYAVKNNNLELAAKVNVSYSALYAGRDTGSGEKCQNVHQAATENLAALGEHGVTAVKLGTLQELIDDFNDCVPKPRAAIGTNKTATTQLEAEFAAADSLLTDRLDKLALQFEQSHPQFYREWLSARVIVDLAASRPGEEAEGADKKVA